MKDCNTCLYGLMGFCTIHHTVPGGCDNYVSKAPIITIHDLNELQEYRKLGTVEEVKAAIEDVQKYRNIGTVEECIVAIEKAKITKQDKEDKERVKNWKL